MRHAIGHICCAAALCTAGVAAAAQEPDAAGRAFAAHCFSPYLTAQKAQSQIAATGARIDFYDLRPFSAAAPSPVTGRAATPGTDRRCEVAFDGEHILTAMEWVNAGLLQEGLATRLVNPPAAFPQTAGTKALSAVQLNPNRIAVTQIGTRPGPNGVETFMNVERLTPLKEGGS